MCPLLTHLPNKSLNPTHTQPKPSQTKWARIQFKSQSKHIPLTLTIIITIAFHHHYPTITLFTTSPILFLTPTTSHPLRPRATHSKLAYHRMSLSMLVKHANKVHTNQRPMTIQMMIETKLSHAVICAFVAGLDFSMYLRTTKHFLKAIKEWSYF